jgi:hypothetical protein
VAIIYKMNVVVSQEEGNNTPSETENDRTLDKNTK